MKNYKILTRQLNNVLTMKLNLKFEIYGNSTQEKTSRKSGVSGVSSNWKLLVVNKTIKKCT